MRKVFGPILIGLGAFLIVVAIMAIAWMPGVVKKTPLDVDNTTRLSGEAQRFDGTALGSPVPISIMSLTQADADASDDNVVVFVNGSCVVENTDGNAPDCVDGEDPRLVSASEDTFATDRVTAEAVPNGDYVPEGTVQHEGLVNKWPFDAEKKTYPYWDGTLGRAVDAEYVDTKDFDGVETYHYKVVIEDEAIEIAEDTPGTYSNEINIWVEPRTGDILNQSQDQQRYLEDGTQVLNLQAEFTEDQIKKSTDGAKDNLRMLDVMLDWVPIAGFVGGALAIVAGILLLLSSRRREAGASSTKPEHRVDASV
ncbi:DUF3068 domain-containing protein [Nocardioides sp. CGMCC 1.13656]|uniref:DUF3068 domain-containing protein n=1 Tax=Nocardioides sp. CGMCC 1.13656 TaxID=2755556 RepID=UPI0012F7281B|nr:DUF3068 domain-containing protein [Nocardioides sp. CGMCC 1.13656]MBA2952383.1 DUF3068 domain-containing protein [Nocardioides sp. CGMCC 1.13656]